MAIIDVLRKYYLSFFEEADNNGLLENHFTLLAIPIEISFMDCLAIEKYVKRLLGTFARQSNIPSSMKCDSWAINMYTVTCTFLFVREPWTGMYVIVEMVVVRIAAVPLSLCTAALILPAIAFKFPLFY